MFIDMILFSYSNPWEVRKTGWKTRPSYSMFPAAGTPPFLKLRGVAGWKRLGGVLVRVDPHMLLFLSKHTCCAFRVIANIFILLIACSIYNHFFPF